MAWPYTPLVTFVDNGGTPCNAAFLNSIQAAINVLGPTTPALGLYTPQILYRDAGGNSRGSIDHNGLPTMGNVAWFNECWTQYTIPTINSTFGSTTTATALGNGGPWTHIPDTSGGGELIPGGTIYTSSQAAGYPGQFVVMRAAANASPRFSTLQANSQAMPHLGFTGLALVAEWDASSLATAQAFTTYMGFDLTGGGNNGDPASSTAYIRFEGGNGANWTCAALGASGGRQTASTSTLSTNGSTNPPLPMQRFRIEVHGSADPVGVGTAFFFVNGNLVGTLSSSGTPQLPITQLPFTINVSNNNNSVVATLLLGVVRMNWNRATAPASLI